MLSPDPADKPMQFFGGVVWDLVRRELAASGDHLLGGKPDTEVHELDAPAAVGPPHEAELLDGEKTKPPVGLFRLELRIGRVVMWPHWCGADRDRASAVPVRAALDFWTHVPCEAHNLVLTLGETLG